MAVPRLCLSVLALLPIASEAAAQQRPLSPQMRASYAQAAARQIDACLLGARPQAPRPEAEQLGVQYRLRFANNGSLAQPPQFVSVSGETRANRRYVRALTDAASLGLTECVPPAALSRRDPGPAGWPPMTIIFRYQTRTAR